MAKNRKILIGTVLAIVTSMLIFLITKTVIKLNHREKISEQTKTLQYLSLRSVGSNKLVDWSKLRKSTVLIFFNSGCEHCQYEVSAIQKELIGFEGVNLLFISEESEEKIIAFSKKYQLDNKENILWLIINPEDVYETFGAISVPHIWIYNNEGILIKEFKGETKVEAILEWL